MSDPNKAAVYAAEKQVRRILDRQHDYPVIELAGSSIVVPVERKFGRLCDIDTYLGLVCGVLEMKPPAVRERKGQQFAHYQRRDHTIAIPTLTRWAMRELVVLHELAHARTAGGHGREFVREFADLARRFMGPEAGLILTILLSDNGAWP